MTKYSNFTQKICGCFCCGVRSLTITVVAIILSTATLADDKISVKLLKKQIDELQQQNALLHLNVLYNRGLNYHNNKEYTLAIKTFSEIILINPQHANAYCQRGNSYAQLRQYEQAIADYEKALTLNQEYTQAYYHCANSYYLSKDYTKAIEYYTKAIQRNDHYLKAYYNRGLCYADMQQNDSAIEDFSKVIELDVTNAEAYHNRGNCYLALEKYPQAVDNYDQAIELTKPLYGHNYYKLKDHDNPTLHVIRLRLCASYHNRALAFQHQEKYDQAIASFTFVIMLNSFIHHPYLNRGLCYFNKGQFDNAIADFTEVIIRSPKNLNAYYYRARSYENYRGENVARFTAISNAISDYEVVIQLDPQQHDVIKHLALFSFQKKYYSSAAKAFSHLIKLNPQNTDYYNYRGVCYQKEGEYDKAIADYEKTLEINPQYEHAIYNMKNTYSAYVKSSYARSEYAKAIALGKKFFALYPQEKDDEIDKYMKWAQEKLGK